MLCKNKLELGALILITTLGFSVHANADPYSERLQSDPTAINRPGTSKMMPREPEFTGSLRTPSLEHQLTQKCSYDTYYWETIYACDPAHNPADPAYIEKQYNR